MPQTFKTIVQFFRALVQMLGGGIVMLILFAPGLLLTAIIFWILAQLARLFGFSAMPDQL